MSARQVVAFSAIALFLWAPVSISAQVACPTPWRLDEVLRIGSRESTDLIGNVNDLAVGPDSVLYVAQAMVPAVKVTMPMPEEGTRLTPGRILADGTLVAARRSITSALPTRPRTSRIAALASLARVAA